MADQESSFDNIGEDLPVSEKRREVLEALFEAATSGNMAAILKWLELHRDQFDEPQDAPPSPIQGEVEPQMLTALRLASQSAVEAQERNNRRGVVAALREIEALLSGTTLERVAPPEGPQIQILDELTDLYQLPK